MNPGGLFLGFVVGSLIVASVIRDFRVAKSRAYFAVLLTLTVLGWPFLANGWTVSIR